MSMRKHFVLRYRDLSYCCRYFSNTIIFEMEMYTDILGFLSTKKSSDSIAKLSTWITYSLL